MSADKLRERRKKEVSRSLNRFNDELESEKRASHSLYPFNDEWEPEKGFSRSLYSFSNEFSSKNSTSTVNRQKRTERRCSQFFFFNPLTCFSYIMPIPGSIGGMAGSGAG